jgi:hypothetical protein
MAFYKPARELGNPWPRLLDTRHIVDELFSEPENSMCGAAMRAHQGMTMTQRNSHLSPAALGATVRLLEPTIAPVPWEHFGDGPRGRGHGKPLERVAWLGDRDSNRSVFGLAPQQVTIGPESPSDGQCAVPGIGNQYGVYRDLTITQPRRLDRTRRRLYAMLGRLYYRLLGPTWPGPHTAPTVVRSCTWPR